MYNIDIVHANPRYRQYFVHFPDQISVTVRIILLQEYWLVSGNVKHERVYCKGHVGGRHIRIWETDKEVDVDWLQRRVWEIGVQKLQMSELGYEDVWDSCGLLGGCDGVLYANSFVQLEMCGIGCETFFKLLSIARKDINPYLRQLKNLIMNSQHHHIQHLHPTPSHLHFFPETSSQTLHFTPLLTILPTTTPGEAANIEAMRNTVHHLEKTYHNDGMYNQPFTINDTHYTDIKNICKNCLYNDEEGYQKVEAMLKLPTIYGILQHRNFAHVMKGLNWLDVDVCIYAWKWKQYHEGELDTPFYRWLEKQPTTQQTILDLEHQKIWQGKYQPNPSYTQHLGWGELNIHHYQHTHNQTSKIQSIKQYVQVLRNYPYKKTNLRYHFYQSQLYIQQQHYYHGKLHLHRCLACSPTPQQKLVIQHQLGVVCGMLGQRTEQYQWYCQALGTKQQIYGKYSMRNLTTIYNILHLLLTASTGKGSLHSHIDQLQEIKKKHSQKKYQEWVQTHPQSHRFIGNIEQILSQPPYSYPLTTLDNPKHKPKPVSPISHPYYTHISTEQQIQQLYTHYIHTHHHTSTLTTIHHLTHNNLSKQNYIRVKFLHAWVLYHHVQMIQGIHLWQELLFHSSKYYNRLVRECLGRAYRQMGLYEQLLEEYYLYGKAELGRDVKGKAECLEYALLWVVVGSKGVHNMSEAHRVLLSVREEQTSPLHMYLLVLTSMHFKKYDTALKLLQKLKNHGQNTISHPLLSVHGYDIQHQQLLIHYSKKHFPHCLNILHDNHSLFLKYLPLTDTFLLTLIEIYLTESSKYLQQLKQLLTIYKHKYPINTQKELMKCIWLVDGVEGFELCYRDGQDSGKVVREVVEMLLDREAGEALLGKAMMRIIQMGVKDKQNSLWFNKHIERVMQFVTERQTDLQTLTQLLTILQELRGPTCSHTLTINVLIYEHLIQQNNYIEAIYIGIFLFDKPVQLTFSCAQLPTLEYYVKENQPLRTNHPFIIEQSWYKQIHSLLNSLQVSFSTVKAELELCQNEQFNEEVLLSSIDSLQSQISTYLPSLYATPYLNQLSQYRQLYHQYF